jgi:hypothetical protein
MSYEREKGYREMILLGSAMATVRSFSRTSLTSLIACELVWKTIGSRENSLHVVWAAAFRTSGLSSSRY